MHIGADVSRRAVMGSLLGAASAHAQQVRLATMWRPKLGILGGYSPTNVAFAKAEGFSSIGFWAHPRGSALKADTISDPEIKAIAAVIANSGLHVSVIGSTLNHIAPDKEQRSRNNAYFVKVLELAGKLGVSYVGTSSGVLPGATLDRQVEEVVRTYSEHYFPVCERYKLRILWEPWIGGPDPMVGPNFASGPIAWEALFKAFGASPFVGLQFDPSHLFWQMMDPVRAARDFIDKIYDVHLKDAEIRWDTLRTTGIGPPVPQKWWAFRLPGLGMIDWKSLFSVFMDAGYSGAMNIENEDLGYGWPPRSVDFSEEYKTGFKLAHRFLKQFVP